MKTIREKTVRIACELSPQSFERLNLLREQVDAATNVEVIRRGLSVFALLVREIKSGGEVHLIRASGEVLLLNLAIVPEESFQK